MVIIAMWKHLYPFRTEKLSTLAPMVLQMWESRALPMYQSSEGCSMLMIK